MRNSFLLAVLILSSFLAKSQNCPGLVDAGPDQFTCDPTMMVQLKGVINGNPNNYEWSPIAGLSDPKVLDPMVTTKVPGKYKFKLTAEVVGTTNFIVNGNFEGGFSGFSTEYAFKTLGQGFGPDNVAIATNPQAYNGGFSNCGDHTSGSGNMWLVDGSTQSGKKVWCQTVAVTPGNTYQFEVYTMSVFPVSPGILDINVNGSSIGGGQVGGMCDWALMMACFKATSGSATICISEVTGVGYGNDFALDDIALYEKCIDEDEVDVEIVDLKAKISIPFKPKCTSEEFDLYATGSSGGPNITYEWYTDRGTIVSQNGLNAKAKGSGTYTVKVVYKNGSVLCEKEASIDYDAPEKLEGIVLSVGTANCALDTVHIDVTMTTGSGSYTYDWSPVADILEGDKTENIKVSKAQTYKVTITDVTTGCKLQLDKTIASDTLAPNFNLNGDTLINCIKNSINISSSLTDTNLYILEWTLPNNNKIFQQQNINSTLSGKYSLKIQNKSNKCINQKSWNANIDTTKPDITLSNTLNIDCINNSIIVLATEKDSNLINKYFWTLTNGTYLTENKLFNKSVSNGGFLVLRTLNQINGCSDLDSIEIKDIRAYPSLSISNPDTLNCIKKSIILDASSSSSNSLSINWTSISGNIVSGSNSLNAVVNKKGIYFIRLVDTTNQCEINDTVEVFENINLPTSILGPDLVFKCNDTLLTIDGSQSSNGANFTYIWKTNNGNIKSGIGTNIIQIDQPGNYVLLVTDRINGCTDSTDINVIPDANKPIVNITPTTKLNCLIQQIQLNAIASSQTGNTLNYKWTADKNQIIQNNSLFNPIITEPGTYLVEVTDQSNGCSSLAQIKIDIDTTKPIANAGIDLIWNCSTTMLNLDGNNSDIGIQYSYIWSSANGQFQPTADSKIITVSKPGTFRLNITNNINGCSNFDDVNIQYDTLKPIINILLPDTLNCIRKDITISSIGSSVGTKYIYQWNSSNGSILNPLNSKDINVDKKGNYVLLIRDTSNNCTASLSVNVFEDYSAPIVNITTPGLLTCKIKTIDIQSTVQNNINASIVWTTNSGNIISGSQGNSPKVNREGWYYITIKNSNGCLITDSVFVAEIKNVPTGLQVDIQQPKCQDDFGILQSLNISGGEAPYMYELDGNKIISIPVTNLTSGNHTLKITDKYGCELSTDFTTVSPNPITVSLPPDTKIDEGSNFSLLLTSSIPTDSIELIDWQPSDKLTCNNCINPSTRNLDEETIFTVTITNKNGCSATASIKIQIIKRGVWTPNVFSPNGDGLNDYFYPVAVPESYKEVKFLDIYDRWGALVFSNKNFPPNSELSGWDGKFKDQNLNPGVYVYNMEIIWNNGETKVLQGDLTLIR
ncbi:MAG: gliding motility-associated C-terminal domain-containing protein [Saprospiraceae bacterium]